jgi:hypothetical protein
MELVDGEDLSQRIARGARFRSMKRCRPRNRSPKPSKCIRAGHHSSRSEARKHQGARRRHGEDTRLRAREGDGRWAGGSGAGGPGGLSMSPMLSLHATQAGAFSAPRPTWRRSKRAERASTSARTSGRLAPCCSRCSRASHRFPVTTSLTCGRVIERDPDWSSLPGDTPAVVRRLLARWLKKDVKAGVRDIGEARQQIEAVLPGADDAVAATARDSSAPSAPRSPSVVSRSLPLAIAVAALAALRIVLAVVAPWRTAQPASRPLVRLDVDLSDNVSLYASPENNSRGIGISPDGTRLAYASGRRPGCSSASSMSPQRLN